MQLISLMDPICKDAAFVFRKTSLDEANGLVAVLGLEPAVRDPVLVLADLPSHVLDHVPGLVPSRLATEMVKHGASLVHSRQWIPRTVVRNLALDRAPFPKDVLTLAHHQSNVRLRLIVVLVLDQLVVHNLPVATILHANPIVVLNLENVLDLGLARVLFPVGILVLVPDQFLLKTKITTEWMIEQEVPSLQKHEDAHKIFV